MQTTSDGKCVGWIFEASIKSKAYSCSPMPHLPSVWNQKMSLCEAWHSLILVILLIVLVIIILIQVHFHFFLIEENNQVLPLISVLKDVKPKHKQYTTNLRLEGRRSCRSFLWCFDVFVLFFLFIIIIIFIKGLVSLHHFREIIQQC